MKSFCKKCGACIGFDLDEMFREGPNIKTKQVSMESSKKGFCSECFEVVA